MLVGALALAWARAGEADALVSRVGALAGEFDRLTTPASATYLRAALRGEFGSHLLSFIRALGGATSDRAVACARRIARHGSTSGIDTLVGLVLAADDDGARARSDRARVPAGVCPRPATSDGDVRSVAIA
jgi:hypothetical protein